MENKTFKHEMFGELEVINKNNDFWFVGRYVAEILGYSNLSRDIQRHVDDEDKCMLNKESTVSVSFEIPDRGLLLINESGLYSLILRSKKEEAKVFKRWVTKEVLPSIRKHGGYTAGQEEMTPEQLMAKAILVAQSKIDEMNGIIKEKDKVIHDKNFPISLTKMFSNNNKLAQAANLWLEDQGYIEKVFNKGVRKGWTLTQEGEDLGHGSQVSKSSVFWTPAILKILPSTKDLLEFAERLDLFNFKQKGAL